MPLPIPVRDCRMVTVTTNGHVLRTQGYSFDGCMSMVRRASNNDLVAGIEINRPGHLPVVFIREGAALVRK